MCFRLPMIWTGGTNNSSNPSTFVGGNSIESEQVPTREAAIPLTGLDGIGMRMKIVELFRFLYTNNGSELVNGVKFYCTLD